MFAQFARVTACQRNVPIYSIQDTLANTIHKVPHTVRYIGFTQFWLRRLEYVKSGNSPLCVSSPVSAYITRGVSSGKMEVRNLRLSFVSCDRSNNRYP